MSDAVDFACGRFGGRVAMLFVFGVWMGLAGGRAEAATRTWINTAGGDYTNAANWQGGILPASTDTVTFVSNAAYAVDFASDQTATGAVFSATDATVTLNLGTSALTLLGYRPLQVSSTAGAIQTNTVVQNGGTLILDGSTSSGVHTPYLASGNSNGVASLIISNGTLRSSSNMWVAVANGNPACGKADLILCNATNIIGNMLHVGGYGGQGNVTLASGNASLVVTGVVTLGEFDTAGIPGSTGTITVASGMATFLGGMNIGYSGSNAFGQLNVLGGTVLIPNPVTMGSRGSTYPYGSGSMLVNGPDARLIISNATITVGGPFAPASRITISQGNFEFQAVAAAYYMNVGSAANSTGVITMTGGTNTMFGSGRLYVGGGGATTATNSVGEVWLVGPNNPVFNALDYNYFGSATGSVGRLVVSNGIFNATGRFSLGLGFGATGEVTIAGGTVAVSGNSSVGAATGGVGRVTITAGSYMQAASTIFNVGSIFGSTGTVSVSNGGLLEANDIRVFAGSQNSMTVAGGGIVQFPVIAPTIMAGADLLVLSNGVVSYRNVTNVNVKGNWSGTQLTNVTFAAGGQNAFRLNSSSNTAATAQSYTFASTLGATNYTRLEMVNGTTCYRGGNVTIDNGGALLLSNTTAQIQGALLVTNGASLAMVGSSLTITGNCTIAQNSVLSLTTNAAAALVTVGGTLVLPATATLTLNTSIARNTQVTLFTANSIDGSPANWSVSPSTHRLQTVGSSLVLMPRAPGFIFKVQ